MGSGSKQGEMMIKDRGHRGAVAIAIAIAGLMMLPPAASAAEPYFLDERLSLTGDCSTSSIDTKPDPDCAGEPPAYPPPPDRPTGRFDRPGSVAVDDWGNLYVASRASGSEGRIDIFDPEGHFIAELDDPHGPQSIAVDGEGNLYAFEEGTLEVVYYPPTTYDPAAGEIEYDPGTRELVAKFPNLSFIYNGLAIDRQDPEDESDDRLYINEGFSISIYSSASEGSTLIDKIEPGMKRGKQIAVDAERRLLYATTCRGPVEGSDCVVRVLEADAPYDLLAEIDGSQTPAEDFFSKEGRLGVAVDETNGHLFVGDLSARNDIYEFDEGYEFVSTFEIPATAGGVQLAMANNPKAPDPTDLNKEDNYRHLFVPFSPLTSTGNAYAFKREGGPPEIVTAGASSVGEGEAELEAHIYPGGLATTYAIEYVSEAQFQVDGFASATLAGTGTIPGANLPRRVSALVDDLQPGTQYRIRVSAENELGTDETEATFASRDDVPIEPAGGCPNRLLRTGASAGLPDCRAYELVTPPDTAGRVPRGAGVEGDYFGMLHATPSGGGVEFLVENGALPGTEATGYIYGDPYRSTRGTDGWSTALAGPTGTQTSDPAPGSFSPDHGFSFWVAFGEGSAVIDGLATGWLRYPDGHSELIGRGSIDVDPQAEGELITENATHTIFQTNFESIPLEPEAPAAGMAAVYDRTRDPLSGAEQTHVVSLLPGEVTPAQSAFYAGASADGEGIAFTIGSTLYLRVDNQASYELGVGAELAGIAEGGQRAFYLKDGNLEAFDAPGEEVTTFADTGPDVVPVNVSPQGNRAYFVSEEAIVGSGANPKGDTAQPGAQNLYLSEGEDTPRFVATVTERDVEGVIELEGQGNFDGLGLLTYSVERSTPAVNPSRLSPDGGVMLFQSRANLDGYDPDGSPQVYRYDAETERLDCLSCPPKGVPATGAGVLQSTYPLNPPAPLGKFSFVPALRSDGARAFFESTAALVGADTDGLRDVYEWEEAGVGSCPAVHEGGCVYLISSGRSSRADYLFAHSESGDDVFVHTSDVLIGGDEETASIYDARVNGGFATEEPIICREEGCRPGLLLPPLLPSPQSTPQAGGSGNVKQCPRGKRKVNRGGKVRCVKKKAKRKHKKQRRAAAERRAGR